MLVKIEARILIFPGTDFHFPSTSVPPGTFLRLWLDTVEARKLVYYGHTTRKQGSCLEKLLFWKKMLCSGNLIF